MQQQVPIYYKTMKLGLSKSIERTFTWRTCMKYGLVAIALNELVTNGNTLMNKGPIINEDAIVALNVPLVEVISIF
jgi:hypothetical protein